MKKLLLNYKLTLSTALVALVFVACGLKFASIEVSNDNPMQGDEITITAKLDRADSEYSGDARYQLFAVRVPEDWTGVSVKATPDEGNGVTIALTASEAYAKFCEFCFPRAGYKWLAYQTEGPIGSGDEATVVAKVKVGNAMDDYALDFAAGAYKNDPAELLKDNGDIDLDIAFGHNTDDNEYTPHPNSGSDYFNSSEYLFIASTISDNEYNTRREAIQAEYTASVTVHPADGDKSETRPVVPDVANRTPNLVTAVTVKANPNGGIDAVEADANAPVEFFNLQGVRVENPAKGVYIRQQGNKVSKVYVK